jgi:photosystem II stability/assembly factor-like uncharacterized protein
VTRDGGETWFWAYEGIRKPYMTIGSRDLMNGVDRTCYEIAVGRDPNHVVIGDHYSAFQTKDGGLTWQSMESNFVREVDGRKFYSTTGIEPAGQSAFAADPSNPNHQFSGWTDIRLWESFDGGQSWTKVVFTPGVIATDSWGVAFDPNNPNIVLSSDVNSNAYKNKHFPEAVLNVIYGDPSVASIRGRLFRSTDGGATWAEAVINEVDGYPNTYLKILPTDIVFDPLKPGVAYFSSNGIGVFRSMDSGATWSVMNGGLELQESTVTPGRFGIGAHEFFLAADGKTLFLHTGRTPIADNKKYGDTYYLDLSTNSTTWTKLNRPNDTKSNFYDKSTWIFVIDRAAEGKLYAGTVARKQVSDTGTDRYRKDGECGGAYVSDDMGAIWRQMYDETRNVESIKADSPQTEHHLYILYRKNTHVRQGQEYDCGRLGRACRHTVLPGE